MEIDTARVLAFLRTGAEIAGLVLTPMEVGQAVVGAARYVDGSAAMEKRLNASVALAFEDMARDAYTACRGVVAHLLHVEPTDELVDRVMNTVHEGPDGPARVKRLLGEATKSAASRRRRLLAAVLYGLPFTTATDDERDRIDMLVERLVPDDIELLGRVASFNDRDSALFAYYVTRGVTDEPRIAAVRRGSGDRQTLEHFAPNGPAFMSLEANGCTTRQRTTLTELVTIDQKHDGTGVHLQVTALGQLLLDALKVIGSDYAIGK